MAECDLSNLPTELIRSAICETVEKRLGSKKYKIDVASASTAGEHNFISDVCRVSFSKDHEIKSDKQEIHKFIVKVAPQDPKRRETFNSRALFLREYYMYEQVLPYFRQFEESKGVIENENGFTEYPECYRTVDIELNECIILEDISVGGFSMIDRFTEEISAEHVRLVMKSLGKYHALSFALKDQQPEKFKELSSGLSELYIRRENEQTVEWFTKIFKNVLEVIPDPEDAILRSKIQNIIDKNTIDEAYDCVDAKLAEPATIISHGDVWQNNTMFKYDENKNPIEVRLLDWQVARHSSPIPDLVYYTFICTTKDLRDAHYDEFLKIYHESLSAHIRRLGSDPEQLFPYKLMLEHLRKFGKFGLIMSTVLLPMITSGNVVDLDDIAIDIESESNENAFINEKTRDKYEKRMRDVIVDMARLEYI